MNQNSFCTKCHRIPSQCVCGNTQRELTDEEINELSEKHLDMDWQTGVIEFARAILQKASEK
jgi:hypothetical protein